MSLLGEIRQNAFLGEIDKLAEKKKAGFWASIGQGLLAKGQAETKRHMASTKRTYAKATTPKSKGVSLAKGDK